MTFSAPSLFLGRITSHSFTPHTFQGLFPHMMTNGRKRTVALVAAICALASTVLLATSATAATPSCFGRTATIVAKPGQVTIGTKGPDVIVGTAGADIIKGKGGRDLICGGGGADKISAGKGRDYVAAGPGDDVVRGGKGHDVIQGGPGDDILRGRKGNDELRAEEGLDKCYGGPGADAFYSCNEAPPAAAAPATSPSEREAQMVALVNDLRSDHGVDPLEVSVDMSGIAREWSGELTNSFRHNTSVSSQLPVGWTAWGENIAYNSSVATAFEALVDSPSHLANMTDDTFTHVGVGIEVENGWVYVTQVFARY